MGTGELPCATPRGVGFPLCGLHQHQRVRVQPASRGLFFPFLSIFCGFCDGQPYGWSGPLLDSPLRDFRLQDIPIENRKWSPNRNSGCFKIPFSQTAGFRLSWPCAEKTLGPVATTRKQESVRGFREGWSHPWVAWPFPAAPSPFEGISALSVAGVALQQPAAPPCPADGAGTPRTARLPLPSPAGMQELGRGCRG